MATTHKEYSTVIVYHGWSRGKPYIQNFVQKTGYSDGHHTVPTPSGKYVKPSHFTCNHKVWTILPVYRVGSNHHLRIFRDGYDTDNYAKFKSIDNMVNKALNDVGNRKMTLGETLAESRGTFNMIAKRASQLTSMLTNLKRGNVKGAAQVVGLNKSSFKNSPRDASNRYLELIFGWKPLIDEVYNGIDVVQNGLNRDPLHAYIGARTSGSYSIVRPGLNSPNSVTCSGSYNAHVKLVYSFTHPSYGRSLDQLGILNLPQLAWNLLPYSFVGDWFLPVGDWLGGFSATQGLTLDDAYCTQHSKNVHTMKPSKYFPDGGQYENVLVQRRRLLSVHPSLPDFETDFSIEKATTSVALLTQRYSR